MGSRLQAPHARAAGLGLGWRKEGLDKVKFRTGDGACRPSWSSTNDKAPVMRGLCWVRRRNLGHVLNRTREHRLVVVFMTTKVGAAIETCLETKPRHEG